MLKAQIMNQEQKIIKKQQEFIQKQQEKQQEIKDAITLNCERLEKDADKIMDVLEEDILKTIAIYRMRSRHYSNNISYFSDLYYTDSYHPSINLYRFEYSSRSVEGNRGRKLLKAHRRKFKVLSSQCENLLSKHYRNYLISELSKRNITIYFADESIFRYLVELDMYIVDPEFIIRQNEKRNKKCIIS